MLARGYRLTLFLALAALGALLWLQAPDGRAQAPAVAVLTIKGPIGPAVADYVSRGIEKAVEQGAAAIVLKMDTPGGLDTSMREIIKDILAAPVPVIGYVGPRGARAASAGTYILYASHVAAMAPATELGAATPVQVGGGGFPFGRQPEPEKEEPAEKTEDADKDEAAESETAEAPEEEAAPKAAKPTIEDKVLQDAIAYIRSLAQLRGRNVEWAEKAVTEAATLTSGDALEAGVIDLVATDVEDLLARVDGREVEMDDGTVTLATAEAAVIEIEKDWRTELLEIITNPTVAVILMTIGFYGIVLEFYTGAVVSGVVGAICLLLGLYGLHVLPINYAGLALIILGMILLIAEAFLPSFGILCCGGVIAFVIGSVMLIDTDVPGLGVSPYFMGAVALLAGGGTLLIATKMYRLRREPVRTGSEEMVGSRGKVLDWSGERGEIRVQGEIWQARGQGPLEPGRAVRVTAMEGMTLVVEPQSEGS